MNSIVALVELPRRPTMGQHAINISVRKHDLRHGLQLESSMAWRCASFSSAYIFSRW